MIAFILSGHALYINPPINDWSLLGALRFLPCYKNNSVLPQV